MTFFNTKEEVLDIEITQYGKYLMSQGKFKPTYYQFFDDDVLYDVAHVSSSAVSKMSELQNSSEPRIQEETPRLKTQYVYTGLETTMKKSQLGQAPVQPTVEKMYALMQPLGTSKMESDYAPALYAKFWNGNITSSSDYLELLYKNPSGVTNVRYANIPQINADIVFKLKASTVDYDPSKKFLDDEKIYQPGDEYAKIPQDLDKEVLVVDFPDQTYLHIEQDYLLIEFDEKNSTFLRENFDIEVFEIEEVYSKGVKTEEILKPLNFSTKYPEYSDELLLDEKDMTYAAVNFSELDSNYVEYYFDIEVDEEIDTEVFCRHKKDDRSKGVFADRTFDCPDIESITQQSIYGPPDSDDGNICED